MTTLNDLQNEFVVKLLEEDNTEQIIAWTREILEKGTVAAMKEGMQTPEINMLVAKNK